MRTLMTLALSLMLFSCVTQPNDFDGEAETTGIKDEVGSAADSDELEHPGMDVEQEFVFAGDMSKKDCAAASFAMARLATEAIARGQEPNHKAVLRCFLSKAEYSILEGSLAAEDFDSAFDVLVFAKPNKNLFYLFVKEHLHSRLDYFFTHEKRQGRRLAWGWGRTADAALEAYTHNGDERLARLVAIQCATLISWTDQKLGFADEIRGEPGPTWGAYVRMIDGKPEPRAYTAEITASGATYGPCARVAALLNRNEATAAKYAPFISQIISHGAKVFDHIVPLSTYHEDTNAITFESGTKTWHEALNHTGVWAEFVAYMYEATGAAKYRDHLQGLLNFMELCSISLPDGRVFTEYRATYETCKGYKDRTDYADIQGEFNYKARQTILIPVHAAAVGLEVDGDVVAGLGQTFRTHVFKESGDWCARLNRGCEDNKTNRRNKKPALAPGWMMIDAFDPQMRNFLIQFVAENKDVFPRGWFTNKTSVLAYARRFKDAPELDLPDPGTFTATVTEKYEEPELEPPLVVQQVIFEPPPQDSADVSMERIETLVANDFGQITKNLLQDYVGEVDLIPELYSDDANGLPSSELDAVRQEIFAASLAYQVERLTASLPDERSKALAIAGWLGSQFKHISAFPDALDGKRGDRWQNYAYRMAACGGRAGLYERMAELAGLKARRFSMFNLNRVGGGHTVVQVFFDGKWNWVDPTYGAYFEVDGNILDWSEIVSSPSTSLAGLKVMSDTEQFRSGRPLELESWRTVSNSDHVKVLYNDSSLSSNTSAGFTRGTQPIVLRAQLDASQLTNKRLDIGQIDGSRNDVHREGVTKRVTEQLSRWGRFGTSFEHSFTFHNLQKDTLVRMTIVPAHVEKGQGQFQVASKGCEIKTDQLSGDFQSVVVGEPIQVTALAEGSQCHLEFAHQTNGKRGGIHLDQMSIEVVSG